METPHPTPTHGVPSNGRDPRVHAVGPPKAVPVYNCVVIVSPRNAAGVVVARVATLPDVAGEGDSERQALQKVVAEFKWRLTKHQTSGEPIPWLNPPLVAQPDEQTRWIAVHL